MDGIPAGRLGLIAGSSMEAAAVPSPRQPLRRVRVARRDERRLRRLLVRQAPPHSRRCRDHDGRCYGGRGCAGGAAPVEDDELLELELLDDDELLDDELDELELLDDDGGGCCRRGRRAGRSDWMTTRSREIPMGRRLAGRRRGLHWATPLLIFSQTSHNLPSSKRLELGGAMAVFVQRGLNCEKMRR